MSKTLPKILIVEDDFPLFGEMEKCLQSHALGRDINIGVIYAHNLVDARQKIMTYRIDIVSTDMTYPVRDKELNEEAGAMLVPFVRRRISPQTATIVYSGHELGDIKRKLEKHGIIENVMQGSKLKNIYPTILKKDPQMSHDTWARAVLDAVMAL